MHNKLCTNRKLLWRWPARSLGFCVYVLCFLVVLSASLSPDAASMEALKAALHLPKDMDWSNPDCCSWAQSLVQLIILGNKVFCFGDSINFEGYSLVSTTDQLHHTWASLNNKKVMRLVKHKQNKNKKQMTKIKYKW